MKLSPYIERFIGRKKAQEEDKEQERQALDTLKLRLKSMKCDCSHCKIIKDGIASDIVDYYKSLK